MREVVAAVERVAGRTVPVRYVQPAADEPAFLVADAQRIASVLAWTPRFADIDTVATHSLVGELRRSQGRASGGSAFLALAGEAGLAPNELRRIIWDFGRPPPDTARSPLDAAASSPVPLAAAVPRPAARPSRSARKLTIGMATYDDYDGVYFTLQSIRLYHPEVLGDVEFIVIDNNPQGPCGRALRALENSIETCRYLPQDGVSGTAVRDWVFQEARTDFVLCVDCHVLIARGALARLLAHFEADPGTSDLLQGPLIYDNLTLCSTHFAPEWREGMYGTWQTDPAGADPDLPPFEIPMQGLGLFACRRAAWPGFNPRFRGFGGEEGYIHEKFRRRGGRVLCLPFLRWLHRFERPFGAAYPNRWEDRIRNYLIGFGELGWDTAPVVEHFRAFLGEHVWSMVVERLGGDPAWEQSGRPAGRQCEDVEAAETMLAAEVGRHRPACL
jgi:hypothetical protein